MKQLTIATRESPLAMWQALYVKNKLLQYHDQLQVNILGMTTKGDQILDKTLAKIGGKGLFVKELETALLHERADIAVHSMKDVPSEFPTGLQLAVICEREDPSDALVSKHYSSLAAIPPNSIIGTSSLRRQCQLLAQRPDLVVKPIRGNVGTRLSKLDSGDYDALIMATAGLHRLQLQQRIGARLDRQTMLPAAGQGAVGIECRNNDSETLQLLAPLSDSNTTHCITAERAMSSYLNGSCQVPIAGFAHIAGEQLHLRGLVGTPDGEQLITSQRSAPAKQAQQLGEQVAQDLLQQGAGQILASLCHE